MPRNADGGRLGKRTMLPSGWMKNFTRSPGFNPRRSRIDLGMVTRPFIVMADSMVAPLAVAKS
jgi:hypothetical protein